MLSFLLLWSNRVYEWFGTLYPRGRDIILNIGAFILIALGQTIANILQWVDTRIGGAIDSFMGWILHYYNAAIAWVNAVRDWLFNLLVQAKDWLFGQLIGVRDWLLSIINGIYAIIETVKAWVLGLIQNAINNVINLVLAGIQWIYGIRDKVLELASLFTPDNISKFLDLLQRIYPTLLTFIQNPVHFILDLLRDKLIGFLCMLLAYGLGTTLYELPAFQSWKDK
jgi:phage-related protein